MFLIVDNEACFSLPTQWLIDWWDDFASLVLLVKKGLEEINKYSCISPSSLLEPLLWTSILEDSKLLVVLGTSRWVVWIHEKLQLDPLRLVHVSPINLVHLLHLGNKRNGGGGGFSRTEGGKAATDLENLLMDIVWIETLQQKWDHSALCWEDNRNLWLSSILDYF
jgi:hypothetical protein